MQNPRSAIESWLPVGGKVWDNVCWRSSSVFPHCFFREPRQARKGAAAAKRAGAGVGLARAASLSLLWNEPPPIGWPWPARPDSLRSKTTPDVIHYQLPDPIAIRLSSYGFFM